MALGRRGLIWSVVGALAVLSVALWFWRGSHFVRRQTRLILEDQLAGLLRGEVHIDHVEQLSFGHVVAKGVTLRDPQKRVVLTAKRLRLDLDLSELPSGIRFSHGHMTDARIRSIPSDDAGISLFEAFLPRDETPGDPSATPFRVTFDDIRIERARVYGDFPGLANVRIEGVTVGARIAVAKGLDVHVASVGGTFVSPFSSAVTIDAARTNIVIADELMRIAARAQLSRGTEQLSAVLAYRLPLAEGAKDALDLRLQLLPVTPEWVREIGLSLPQTLYGELRGPVHLWGPRDHLRFDVSLETGGGPLLVRGELPTGGTSRVHVESPRLSLPEVMAYAPPVSLGLRVDVEAPFTGPVQIRGAAPFVDVMGFTATDATLKGEYENGTFRILDAVLDYAGGHFRVSGTVDENADFDLRVQSDIPDTRRDPTLRATGFDAAIDADLRLSRKADDITAEGRIALQNAHYEGVSARQLVMEGRAEILDDDYEKPVLRVRGRAAELSIPGLVDGAVTLALDGKDGHYVSNLSIQDPRGRSLTARASLTQLARGYRIQADPLTLAVTGREPWRAQADVIVHDEGIELRKVQLVSGPQRLELSGTYSYSQAYGVDANLQAFDVGGLRELLGIDLADLDGTVDGELHLTGVPGQPRIDAQGSLRHGVFLGMKDLTVLLSLVFVENRFDVETEVQLPDGSRLAIYAGGEPGRGASWGTQIENGNYQFGLDFEQLPFEVTRPWLSWLGLEPPGGKVSAMVRGAGTLDAPTLELTSRVEKLALEGYAPLDLDVALKHDSRVLELERLKVADELGELVTLSGTVEAELAELFDVQALRASLDTRPFEVRVRLPPRRLDALPAPFTRDEWPVYASGELEVTQTDAGPSVTLASRLGWPKNMPGLDACGLERHAELVMLLRAQGLSANLEATIMADADTIGSITASGRPDVTAWLTGAQEPHVVPTQVEARLHAQATEELPVLCQYVAGPLRAELFAGDIFATPPELRFLVESGSLQLVPRLSQSQKLGNLRSARTVGRAFKLSASGGVERERVSFAVKVDQGPGASLEAYGAVPRAAFVPREKRRPGLEPIEARLVATRFELSPVLLALPVDVRAAGRLDGNVRMAYGLDNEQIQLEGALDLSEGHLAVAALGQELSDLTATLRMTGNTLRITDLETHDFDGKLAAKGALVFNSVSEVQSDLRFELDEFPLRREGIQVSKVTGVVAMRAELGSERTRAEIDLSNLRVDLPQELDTSLQPLDAHPDITVKGEPPPETPEHPYVIDLRIRANPPFRIRRTDLSADVLTDLDVHYADPALILQGSAELKRGSFELYGKRFELEEGRVAFDGSEEIDPLVSLYAIHKIGGDEIGVRVEGRLSSPSVTFTHSDPSVTDTGEIIAQLLGARRDDTSNSNQDATGAAANMLAGATAGLLTQEVRNKFGGNLPVLSFESGNQAFRNARIRAGVQLDTFVEKRLGPLRHVVRGAYIEGFVSPGAGTDSEQRSQSTVPQSRGGGLLELRFPRDFVGTVEYRPVQNWRLDVAWEP